MIVFHGKHRTYLNPGDNGGSIEDLDAADSGGGAPSFDDLFEDEAPSRSSTVDLSQRTFKRTEKLLENPKPYFSNPDFYKVLLSGEGDIAKRIHQILQEFLKATDAQEKSAHRAKLVPAYWELYSSVAEKIGHKLADAKQLLLRYAVLLPTVISAEQRQLIASIPLRNESGEPIYYVDEWLREVATGRVSTSAVDETKAPRGNEAAKFSQALDKAQGRYDAQMSLVTNLSQEIVSFEQMMLDHAQNLSRHDPMPGYDQLIMPYTDSQRSSFSELGELLRKLSNSNRRLQEANRELDSISEQLESLRSKEGEMDQEDSEVDTKIVTEELNTIKQMAKMCIGRQGNPFPMLMQTYFKGNIPEIGTRENVTNILADLEYLDAGLFQRTFKQQTNRIVPNIVLMPCYGDVGICWEPFERHNRATSRGRMAIPMYPKDLRVAIISAMADLRWQVAKEKAQHYWMEEGLTGWYYQWFTEAKLKGDVKDQFIVDYILWITKESEGNQKVDKQVREIFWRYMPYPQDLKDKLKLRGFAYQELAKKDQNRALSDGY